MEINRVKLTSAQLQAWDDTRALLMYYAPSLTHLFYTLMNRDDDYIAVFTDSPEVPTAATDGVCMIFNVDGYLKRPLLERLFILVHEIIHNILNHIVLLHHVKRTGKVIDSDGRVLPFDEYTFQMSMDLVVNAIAVESKLGKLPADATYDLSKATHLDSVIDVYHRQAKIGRGKGPGGEGGGFDTHLEPGEGEGKDPSEAESERNQTEWDVHIKAAMDLAASQGKLPAGLKRLFEEIIEDKIDWTDIVQSWFARRVGSGSWDWKRPDRKLIVRDIWAPGRTGHGADLVVVANDTSGSINDDILNRWHGVLSSILQQLRPKLLLVIWCDAAVGQVDEIEEASDLEDLMRRGAPGGGGTDFRPVFDYIDERHLMPDALVFLTDGYGTFPQYAPEYPTFWGSIGLEPKGYPFGEVVMIPMD